MCSCGRAKCYSTRWSKPDPTHGALPRRAPSPRCTADLVHHVWHRSKPRRVASTRRAAGRAAAASRCRRRGGRASHAGRGRTSAECGRTSATARASCAAVWADSAAAGAGGGRAGASARSRGRVSGTLGHSTARRRTAHGALPCPIALPHRAPSTSALLSPRTMCGTGAASDQGLLFHLALRERITYLLTYLLTLVVLTYYTL